MPTEDFDLGRCSRHCKIKSFTPIWLAQPLVGVKNKRYRWGFFATLTQSGPTKAPFPFYKRAPPEIGVVAMTLGEAICGEPYGSKVIQISAAGHDNTSTTQSNLSCFALCEDGTIWLIDTASLRWTKMPELPHD